MKVAFELQKDHTGEHSENKLTLCKITNKDNLVGYFKILGD